MGSAIRYEPACHCFVCITHKQVSATKKVVKGDRTYRTCDEHYEVVERAASIWDALQEIRRNRKIGGAA